jgi:hypothetical protein
MRIEVLMKTRGAGSFAITALIFVIAFTLMARATGMDSWIFSTLLDIASAFRVATGYNLGDFFSNVSLAAEFRTYGEVLATNWNLQMYFIGGGICALLSSIFILRGSVRQLWSHHAVFVAFMILLLLPVALTMVTYSEIFASRSVSYFCLAILLLLGSFSCYELMRVPTRGFLSKAAQALVLLLVLFQGVIIPVMYGAKFIFNS